MSHWKRLLQGTIELPFVAGPSADGRVLECILYGCRPASYARMGPRERPVAGEKTGHGLPRVARGCCLERHAG
jgi:hypothetical protein